MREQVLALRRGKYEGFNDQHFTEKLVEVEGLRLSRETVRRILRNAGIGSPRKRRAPKHRRRRERKAQAGQMILWDGSEHDWLEGRGPRLCLMGAVDDATGELLPGAHFTEQESTVGYLRVLRDILREKGIPHTVYGDRHSSLRRNDKHWTLEEELAGRQQPTQVGRALANLGVALHYVRKVYKNNTVRLHGHVIDIPKRLGSRYATYAGKDVVVKHLLSGDYRVFYGEECIAWASGSRPKPSTTSNRNNDKNDEGVTLSPSS
ncbi:MAG: hypothetical protein QM756_36660 [Polyangiaceae bacterium]